MGERRSFGGFLGGLVLLALAFVAIGCGSDSSTETGTDETAAKKQRPFPYITGAAREFLIIGGDNLVQTFGEEASDAEREKASKIVHLWMKARVAEDWVTDCRYLSRDYIKILLPDARSVSGGKARTCPQALEYFGDAASGTSGNTLTGPIDSLRVRKPLQSKAELEAYAQWHGPERDWVLPMKRENGVWKVDIASPLDREK